MSDRLPPPPGETGRELTTEEIALALKTAREKVTRPHPPRVDVQQVPHVPTQPRRVR